MPTWEFKPGDKVRCVQGHFDRRGHPFTLIEGETYTVSLLRDDKIETIEHGETRGWYAYRFVLAETPTVPAIEVEQPAALYAFFKQPLTPNTCAKCAAPLNQDGKCTGGYHE